MTRLVFLVFYVCHVWLKYLLPTNKMQSLFPRVLALAWTICEYVSAGEKEFAPPLIPVSDQTHETGHSWNREADTKDHGDSVTIIPV